MLNAKIKAKVTIDDLIYYAIPCKIDYTKQYYCYHTDDYVDTPVSTVGVFVERINNSISILTKSGYRESIHINDIICVSVGAERIIEILKEELKCL